MFEPNFSSLARCSSRRSILVRCSQVLVAVGLGMPFFGERALAAGPPGPNAIPDPGASCPNGCGGCPPGTYPPNCGCIDCGCCPGCVPFGTWCGGSPTAYGGTCPSQCESGWRWYCCEGGRLYKCQDCCNCVGLGYPTCNTRGAMNLSC